MSESDASCRDCTPHAAENWKKFTSACERFGVVTMTMDMEDYGREPGDIVWVNIPIEGARGFGPACAALDEAIAMAERHSRAAWQSTP